MSGRGETVNEDVVRHPLMCPSITSKSVGPQKPAALSFTAFFFTAVEILHQGPVASHVCKYEGDYRSAFRSPARPDQPDQQFVCYQTKVMHWNRHVTDVIGIRSIRSQEVHQDGGCVEARIKDFYPGDRC